jgi:Na+-transporting NADH:ubiquinone oxidoreductase subunit NqrE
VHWLGLATFMEASARLGHGLGLGGSFVVNLTIAFVLAGLLYLGEGSHTRRGRAIMWILVATLVTLAAFELAYI